MSDGKYLLLLTIKYAAIALAIFLVQAFPYAGIFLMVAGGPFLIGILFNIYLIHIIFGTLSQRRSRWLLAIPVASYSLSAALGVYSDLMAYRWLQDKNLIQIETNIPNSVRHITFDPWNKLDGSNLEDSSGVFRPEDLDFSINLFLAIETNSKRGQTLKFLSNARPYCFHEKNSVRIGDRCFESNEAEIPTSFLRIGGPRYLRGSPDPSQWPPPTFNWGTVYFGYTNIVLHHDGKQVLVGRLGGGVIRKLSYLPFPTAGCGLNSAAPSWNCFGSFVMAWRSENVGFHPSVVGSSPDTAAILMTALRQLRGGNALRGSI
jgi:hypothetical protein